MKHELAIVSCQAARAFSERVVEHLRALYVENKDNPAISDEPSNIHLTEAGGVSEPDKVTAFFEDGEPAHRLREAVHGRDIFVIQTLQSPVSLPGRSINDNLVELCHLNHTLCLSDAAQITNVIPYGGAYGRQDRKVKAREGISTQFSCLNARRNASP